MGRELQKKKNRSSIAKVRRKPKPKKRILQNSIIAANWDKTQTLAQNYRRLGLTAKLNKNTGGVERTVVDVVREQDVEESGAGRGRGIDDALSIAAARRRERLDVREAKIEREPGSGRILKVVDDGETAKANPLNDPLNDLDSDSDDSEFNGFDQHLSTNNQSTSKPAKTPVVMALEERASRPAAKYRRKQSDGEREFIEQLVGKYGEDIEAMARDVRINYMQRSEGDLRRRVRRWREGGGRLVA